MRLTSLEYQCLSKIVFSSAWDGIQLSRCCGRCYRKRFDVCFLIGRKQNSAIKSTLFGFECRRLNSCLIFKFCVGGDKDVKRTFHVNFVKGYTHPDVERGIEKRKDVNLIMRQHNHPGNDAKLEGLMRINCQKIVSTTWNILTRFSRPWRKSKVCSEEKR